MFLLSTEDFFRTRHPFFPTWLVVFPGCHVRNPFPRAKIPEIPPCRYENRADLRGPPCFLLQIYNIFRPKANCVKMPLRQQSLQAVEFRRHQSRTPWNRGGRKPAAGRPPRPSSPHILCGCHKNMLHLHIGRQAAGQRYFFQEKKIGRASCRERG